ncbi:MAG: methionine adenosyltransferase [Peptococcaceae bacterium]|nr:methionine adenosyltransferase [Candidatus Syntrophopropionicum ammoniitolerans]
MAKQFFTSESVTEGHPDKVADLISDSILDALISKDPASRVAVETLVSTGLVAVAGEVSANCYVDIPRIVRKTVHDIGYTRAKYGFDGDTCAIITTLDEQSGDIAMGVNSSLEQKCEDSTGNEVEATGAGDQGMMFGYASNETAELMPMPILLASKMAARLAHVRKGKLIDYLYPDGKTQVTVQYEGGQPVRIDTVVVAAQHKPTVAHKNIEQDIMGAVIKEVVPPGMLDKKTRILVNPTGRFVLGGPQADAGLTGRKIISDTYGGMARHGGGAFSGKDPTKVDRSAAYAARYVAKNIVAAGLADKCEIQLAYAIGVANPVSIYVDTFGTGKVADRELVNLIREHFDLRPGAIIKKLHLRRPIYQRTACYGHFGRPDPDFYWERTDKAEILRQSV